MRPVDMAALGPSKNTRPERVFQMILVRHGISYRRQVRWGPGNRWRADFVVGGVIVDVHGSHWHGRKSRMYSMSEYWREKIRMNRARDRAKVTYAAERDIVYRVLWDHSLVSRARLSGREIIDLIRP